MTAEVTAADALFGFGSLNRANAGASAALDASIGDGICHYVHPPYSFFNNIVSHYSKIARGFYCKYSFAALR